VLDREAKLFVKNARAPAFLLGRDHDQPPVDL
jgi:hypothetical protein